MKNTKYFSLIIFMVITAENNSLSAQETGQIRLMDLITAEPVVGAAYNYDKQSGSSDKEGYIYIRYVEGADLSITHISYGKWIIKNTDVRGYLQKGVFNLSPEEKSLHPVTIIELRHKTGKPETFELDYGEKMFHDVGSILKRTPVFSGIRRSGSYGFDPVFRGFKYDQLNIVLNGSQSATAACPNRMDPPTSHIATNMIDHVEIFKGPHSLRFGNAFGGTINFIQTAPVFTDKMKIFGRASTGYETNGMLFRNEGVAGFRSKRSDMALYASWSQGSDYKDGNGTKVGSGFRRGSLGSSLGIKITNDHKLGFSAIHDFARDADFPALMMDLRKDNTWMLNASHIFKRDTGVLRSLITTVYETSVDHRMDNLLKVMDPRMLNAATNAMTKTYGGRTEGTWEFRNSTLLAGADLKIEEASGIRVREFIMGPNIGKIFYDNAWQSGKISKSALFTEYHTHAKKLQFVFSGRIEINHSELADPMPEFTKVNQKTGITQINPCLSLGGVLKTGKSMSVGLWAGRSQRSGSLPERFINYFPIGQDPYEMVGNPAVSPEVNNQLDITYEFRTLTTSVNLDVFGSWIQDHISSIVDSTISPRLPSSPGVRQFTNISKALRTGFELAWIQELVAGLSHQASVAFTYGQDLGRDEPLPEIAPFDIRYRLFGSYFKGQLSPEITMRHVFAQNRVSNEFAEKRSPAFTSVDMEINTQILKGCTISAGILNLFGEAYHEHLTRAIQGKGEPINAPGRSFMVAVSYDFF